MKYFVRILIGGNPTRRLAVLDVASTGNEDYFYGSYGGMDEVMIFHSLKDAIDCANTFAGWYFPSIASLLSREPRSVEVVELVDDQPAQTHHALRSEDYLYTLALKGGSQDTTARIASDLGLDLSPNPRAAAVVALVAEAARYNNPPFGPRYDELLDLARAALWQHPDRAPVRVPGTYWLRRRRR